MNLLNWDGVEPNQPRTLRDLVDNMRKVGGLVEMVSLVVEVSDNSMYDEATADELLCEAGSLVERLGARAIKLLDAQAPPAAPTPIRKPRARAAKRRAA
jgi:hypothetical protein